MPQPRDHATGPRWRPHSIYRVVLTSDFTLNHVANNAQGVAALGFDAIRISPILTTSTQGPPGAGAPTDPTTVDPRLGGMEGLRHLSTQAHAHNLGVIVDCVPGALSIADTHANPYWNDVLAQGRSSPYAHWFDIDWDTPTHFNYRRVNADSTLVSIRVHDPDVFTATHATIGQWFKEGLVDGVSVRHIDSIADPQAYLNQLEALTGGFIITEKRYALTTGGNRETAPATWPGSPATGYPLIAAIDGLLTHNHGFYYLEAFRQQLASGIDPTQAVDPTHATNLHESATFLRRHPTAVSGLLTQIVTTAKREVTADRMSPERFHLARSAKAAWAHLDEATRLRIGTDPTGEVSLENLAEVFGILTASIPVARADTTTDTAAMREGFLSAFTSPHPDDFLGANTTGDIPLITAGPMMVARALSRVRVAARAAVASDRLTAYLGVLLTTPGHPITTLFSQTTSDVLNLGVTETAHYRYCTLAALNEVGGRPCEPGSLSQLIEEFQRQASAQPGPVINALTSPVTKYTRAQRSRIVALSEVPAQFTRFIARMRQLQPLDYSGDQPDIRINADISLGQNPAIAPAATDTSFDILVWQSIIGAWGADFNPAYAITRAHRAARRAAGTHPNLRLIASLTNAIEATQCNPQVASALTDLVASVEAAGVRNAVVARAFQLMAPGIPEVFDPGLPHPPHATIPSQADFSQPSPSPEAPSTAPCGPTRLLSIGLALRKRHRQIFETPTAPSPVAITGECLDHAFGLAYFSSALAPDLVIVAERLPITLATRGGWQDTRVHIPTAVDAPGDSTATAVMPVVATPEFAWRDAISSRTFTGLDFSIAEVLATNPVAFLERVT